MIFGWHSLEIWIEISGDLDKIQMVDGKYCLQ